MALSSETLSKIEAAETALNEYLEKRKAEIDDLANNLKNYGVPLTSLSEDAVESATDEAMATIESLLA